jgi:hypothetical protein
MFGLLYGFGYGEFEFAKGVRQCSMDLDVGEGPAIKSIIGVTALQ